MLPVLPHHASGTGCAAGDSRGPGITTVPESLTVAARADRVEIARAFVGRLLGSHPCTEIAVLLVSELVTNSIRHSHSRLPGGVVTVAALAGDDAVRVEVTDRSGPTVPLVRDGAGTLTEGGRGLQLVDTLATSWGFQQSDGRTTTWFECTA